MIFERIASTRESSLDNPMLIDSMVDIPFPQPVLSMSLSGRYGAFLFATGVAVLDFKHLISESVRVVEFFSVRNATCVALSRKKHFALGTFHGVLLDEVLLCAPNCPPRANAVTALAWVGEFLAVGTLAGTVQLWDGSKLLWANKGPLYPVGAQICSDGDFFCTIHADSIHVWEIFSGSVQILSPSRGLVTSVQFMRSVIVFSTSQGLWTIGIADGEIQRIGDACTNFLLIPETLIVAATDSEVVLTDMDDLSYTKTVLMDAHQSLLLGYLPELHLLASFSENSLRLLRQGTLESSPRMHYTQSSATFISEPVDVLDEWRPVRIGISAIKRSLQRMYFNVQEDDEFTIRVLYFSDDENNVSKCISLKVDITDGVVATNDESGEKFTIEDILNWPEKIVSYFEKNIKPDFFEEEVIFPFPATCGVCWSPQGDLYRFSSLKGLQPFPKFRSKLSMIHFHSLDGSINAFWPFLESASDVAIDDSERVSEFERQVRTDQCVQYVPASLFERLINDHWFAHIAPKINFSLSPTEFCLQMVEITRPIAPSVVIEFWLCLHQLTLIAPSFIWIKIFEEKIKQVYLAEETQSVALAAAILSFILPSIAPGLRQVCTVVMHDHAGFLARIGCHHSTRFVENIVHKFSPLPLLGDLVGLPVFSNSDCFVCNMHAYGLCQSCSKCGHGGHVKHVDAHFAVHRTCYCGCPCVVTSVFDSVRSQ